MKPIKLKIKGVNSFMKEQTIDFSKLTFRGLFGIFGPTGSGKSTVLDGITLSLYGNVSRKSSNFINTNMNSCNVSFEFSIKTLSSGFNTYRVEREYKTDKKTGSPRSGKCKIIDITDGRENILADKSTDVTHKCEEIIGLTLDDFTRTVVLPQGKFSEFLKLEGKPRREMLERLFNLQKYGDNLSYKLSKEISKCRSDSSYLDGIISGNENINEENYKQLSSEYKKVKDDFETASENAKHIKKKYEDSQSIWKLQNELNDYLKNKSSMLDKKNEVDCLIKKIDRAEATYRIMPYYQAYESTIESIKKVSNQLENSKDNLEIKKREKILSETKYNEIKKNREENLPKLTLKYERAKDCLVLEKNHKIILNDVLSSKDLLNNLCSKISSNKIETEKTLELINSTNNKIIDLEKEAKNIKVDIDYKNLIIDGLNHEKDLNKATKDIEEKDIKVNKILSEIAIYESKYSDFNNNYNELKQNLSEKKDKLYKLETCKPIDIDIKNMQNAIFDKQQELNDHQNLWQSYDRLNKENKNHNETYNNCKAKVDTLNRQKEQIEIDISQIKDEIERKNTEVLAIKLRKNIKGNDICPVCGSKIHDIKHIEINTEAELKELHEINTLNTRLRELESSQIAIISSLTANQTKLSDADNLIKENIKLISEMGTDFLNISVDEMKNNFNNLKISIELYTNEYEILNKEIISIENELNVKANEIKNINQNLKKLNEDKLLLYNERKLLKSNLEDVKEKYHFISEKTGIELFQKEYETINLKEKQRESILSDISIKRNYLSEINKKNTELTNELVKLQQSETKLATEIEQKEKSISNIKNEILEKVGQIGDLSSYIKELENDIKELNDEFITIDNYRESCSKQYDKANELFIQLQSKHSELQSSKYKNHENLKKSIEEEHFENIDQVKESYIDKEKLNEIINYVDDYKKSYSKLEGMIEAIKIKLNNKSISENEWIDIQSLKNQNDELLNELNKKNIQLSSEIDVFKNKLIEINDTLKKKEKLSHKIGLLLDLEKLFKGKKFVEYAALKRLKYISIEADKKLKEISSGNYGLEADENGKFIIRDYKNGGAKRDASTLSGGETFITSLALALSLSAEIQLKGTAPLELFFLDEGFGTLDDELLDVVMSSLERIHNDRLKIGIISHVESIKNRVPIKLLITPAEAGKGGSKVKLDY